MGRRSGSRCRLGRRGRPWADDTPADAATAHGAAGCRHRAGGAGDHHDRRLLGAAVLFLRDGQGPGRWRFGRAVAALVTVFGVVVLYEYLVGAIGIDEALFDDPGPTPGRPAPHTAIVFVLLGSGLATLDSRRVRASGWLIGAAAAVVISALVGYVYSVDFLRSTSGTTGIAINTALALAAATIGAASLRPERDLVGYLRRADSGATTARHLLPAVVVVPLLFGLLRLTSEELGLEPAVGIGLNALATMGVFLALVLVVSAKLSTPVGSSTSTCRRRSRLDTPPTN